MTAILTGLLLSMLAGLPAPPAAEAGLPPQAQSCENVRRLGQPGYVTFDGVRIARVSHWIATCQGKRMKSARLTVYQSFVERGLDYGIVAYVRTKRGSTYGLRAKERPARTVYSTYTDTWGKCTRAVGGVRIEFPGREPVVRVGYSKGWTWPCR